MFTCDVHAVHPRRTRGAHAMHTRCTRGAPAVRTCESELMIEMAPMSCRISSAAMVSPGEG